MSRIDSGCPPGMTGCRVDCWFRYERKNMPKFLPEHYSKSNVRFKSDKVFKLTGKVKFHPRFGETVEEVKLSYG